MCTDWLPVGVHHQTPPTLNTQDKESKSMETVLLQSLEAVSHLNGKYTLEKLFLDGGQMGMITNSSVAPKALFPGFNSPIGTSIRVWAVAISQPITMCSN